MLAEELALLAINPSKRRHRRGDRAELNACLAGLLLAELVLDGRAEFGDRKTVVLTDDGPIPDELQPVVEIVEERGPKVKAILSHMRRGLQRRTGYGTWDLVVSRLSAAELRTREKVVARYRDAAAYDRELDTRTALVLACTGPAHLLEIVAPERKHRRHARRRIDHGLDGTEFEDLVKAVKKLIADNGSAPVVTG